MTSVIRLDMLAVFQVDEGPELWISPENDMASAAAVTSVWAAFWDVFGPVKMHRTCTSVTGDAVDLDVVYEIAVRHDP